MAHRRLYLPGGGHFDLQTPNNGLAYSAPDRPLPGAFAGPLGADPVSSGSWQQAAIPVLGGALLGGAVAFLLYRLLR